MSGPDDVERVDRLLGWAGEFNKENAAEIFDEFFGKEKDSSDSSETKSATTTAAVERARLCHAQLLLRAFAFAREAQFSATKTVVCLTILRTVMDYDAQDELISLAQSFKKFRDLLLLHSCERPPWTVLVFTETDIVQLTEFALNTYFRHHAVYKRIYTTHKIANIQQASVVELDKPMTVMSLSQMVELAPETKDDANDADGIGSDNVDEQDGEEGDGEEGGGDLSPEELKAKMIASKRDKLVEGLEEKERELVLAAAAAILERRTAKQQAAAA